MRIVYTRPDGGVSVVHPIGDIQKSLLRLPKYAINPQIVNDSVVPKDRTFRDGWKQSGNSVTHDMNKCREIHRERMRVARKPLLAALDIQQLRGIDVEAQKQSLRDVTADPAIESARTPEELKAVWPEVLK